MRDISVIFRSQAVLIPSPLDVAKLAYKHALILKDRIIDHMNEVDRHNAAFQAYLDELGIERCVRHKPRELIQNFYASRQP